MHSIAVLTPTAAPDAKLKCECGCYYFVLPALFRSFSLIVAFLFSSFYSFFHAVSTVAFKLYDADKRGAISPSDVKFLLAASFTENGIAISESAIDKLVADTFHQYDANRDGVMDFNEFKNMCTLNPNVLKPLTLNVSEMIASAGGGAAISAGGE
jgi:EF-hand domain pair